MSTHYGVDLKEPLLTQVNVVDDFFPPEVFYQVHKWFTHECYWFYNPYVNKEGDHPDDYQFQHVFLLPDRGVVTDCMFALQPFFDRIPASEWIRVKANLRPKCHEMRVGGFHIDYEDCITSIFYFNENFYQPGAMRRWGMLECFSIFFFYYFFPLLAPIKLGAVCEVKSRINLSSLCIRAIKLCTSSTLKLL